MDTKRFGSSLLGCLLATSLGVGGCSAIQPVPNPTPTSTGGATTPAQPDCPAGQTLWGGVFPDPCCLRSPRTGITLYTCAESRNAAVAPIDEQLKKLAENCKPPAK